MFSLYENRYEIEIVKPIGHPIGIVLQQLESVRENVKQIKINKFKIKNYRYKEYFNKKKLENLSIERIFYRKFINSENFL